jgi:predicted ATPase
LAFEVLADPSRFPTLGHLRVLLKSTRVIGALPTSPSWARSDVMTASPRDSVVLGPQQFIGRQGLGLANVLYTLFTDHADAWRDLDRDFRGEFRFVERMTFPAEMSGSKIAFAFEDSRFKGRKMFASEMSDGMVAYLCLLATVHNPEQVGALGLDEPDANLHPSALRRFLSAAQRPHPRGRRLIIVTHSNALLDELDDPASSIRLVDSTKDGTVIRKLDAAALDAWRKDFSLSDLRRTGLIDASNTAYWSEVAGEE